MLIEPFRAEDIPGFLELASAEGWLADPWEFDFLLSAFPSGCFMARETNSARVAGFVTALRHERSGWVGNLIVRPEQRGNGIGEALFLRAVDALSTAGAETVWLTASHVGRSLYEKHGFNRIDTISRWSGAVGQGNAAPKAAVAGSATTASVSGLDCQAWGDRRDALMDAVTGRGSPLVSDRGFLVLQPCGSFLQLGPFAAHEYAEAERLLDSTLVTVPPRTTLCLDAPNLNHGALQLFTAKGLRIIGSNELMFCGVKPAYRPEYLYGLATMGSLG